MGFSARIAIAFLVGLVVLTVVGYVGLLRLNVLPRLAFAPGWSLVDDHGNRVTSEDLRGAVTLYTFDYAGNRDPSRRTHEIMRGVQEKLEQQDLGDVSVRLVTLSVDPSRDTPPALNELRHKLGADSLRWIFATGDSTALRTTVNYGFGIYYESATDGRISFDPTFLIVDGLGIERARYRFGLPAADAIVSDMMSVVREAQAATGSTRLAYEAAHLFSCYARPSS